MVSHQEKFEGQFWTKFKKNRYFLHQDCIERIKECPKVHSLFCLSNNFQIYEKRPTVTCISSLKNLSPNLKIGFIPFCEKTYIKFSKKMVEKILKRFTTFCSSSIHRSPSVKLAMAWQNPCCITKPIQHGKSHTVWVLPCHHISHGYMVKPM